MIYIEDFLEQAKELVKSKMNDKLLEIDSERGDLVLKPVDFDNAVVFQSMNNLPVNFDPILYYGATSVSTDGNVESSVGETWEVEFSVILADPQDRSIEKRLFRYQRALKEIFLQNYFKINNIRQKVRLRSLNPISFNLQNNSIEYRAIGILIETTLFE